MLEQLKDYNSPANVWLRSQSTPQKMGVALTVGVIGGVATYVTTKFLVRNLPE